MMLIKDSYFTIKHKMQENYSFFGQTFLTELFTNKSELSISEFNTGIVNQNLLTQFVTLV